MRHIKKQGLCEGLKTEELFQGVNIKKSNTQYPVFHSLQNSNSPFQPSGEKFRLFTREN